MTRPSHRMFARFFAILCANVVWMGAIPTAEAASRATNQTAKKTVARTTASRTKTQPQKSPKSRTSSRRAYSSSRSAARRARLARAVLIQRQRELRELASPRYRVDDSGSVVPDVRAEAAIIYNPTTQEILWEENANNTRSIASITKVMTALVFLENDFDPTQVITVDAADVRRTPVTYLRGGERLTADDLLHLMLIASDNGAARTLAHFSPLGLAAFVDRMNEKAVELGLSSTHYADPSGLDANNVSSAFDMARLIGFASSDERIASIMRTSQYDITTSRRKLTVHNTNRLVGSEIDVRAGKTGFISRSGYCLATLLKLPQSGEQVAVVVLGARSNAARFWETRHLFNWLAAKTALMVNPTGKSEQQ